MIYDLFVQAIGFIAVACFIISFQIKSNKALFFIQMVGSAVFCVQYLLLGAVSGCYNFLIGIVRNILICMRDKWKWAGWNGWVVIFCVASIVVMFVTWKGFISILPTAAVIAGTIGYWKDNAQIIRLCNLAIISPAWLIYGVYAGSIGAVLNEVFVLTSIIISIWRYGWKNMGNANFGKNVEMKEEERTEHE